MASSSSESSLSSLWLERARFTGGNAATSCKDMMRAAYILSEMWRTLRPAAAAACCALRWSSCTLLRASHFTRDANVLWATIFGNFITRVCVVTR